MIRTLIAFGAGLIFAAGLALSGMTQPAKVIGFLDFFGQWDPALVFVMGGAVGTFFLLHRVTHFARPVFSSRFHLPTKKNLDPSLVVGSIMFGIGWGLLGFCPGPALVSLPTLEPQVLTVVGAMMAGMLAHSLWARWWPKKKE